MAANRSAQKQQSSTLAQQSALTDFFDVSRPVRSSAKKASSVIKTTTSTRSQAAKARRDKALAAATAASPVIRGCDIDYGDFSPTKRVLPPTTDDDDNDVHVPPTTNTTASSNPSLSCSSPSKRSKASVGEAVVARRQTRSKSRVATASTVKSTNKMIDVGPSISAHDFEDTIKRNLRQSARVAATAKPTSTTTSTSAESKLSDADVREKLKGCKNLSELKQRLLKINDCAEKVKQFKQMKVCSTPPKPVKLQSPFKRLTPEKFSVAHLSPLGSPLRAKFQKSVHPVKAPSCVKRLFDDASPANDPNNNDLNTLEPKLPAHKRFGHLFNSTTSTPADAAPQVQLELPAHFKTLVELFKRVDPFVWTHYKRHQVCTFKKIKEMVEGFTSRSFEVSHLLKMQTLAERMGTKWFKLSYAVHDHEKQLCVSSYIGQQVKCINSVTVLLEREREFYDCLVELVKKSHLQFLSKVKLSLEPDAKIFKWHPMFDLTAVPDIVPDNSLLPKCDLKKSADRNSILNYIVFRSETTETTTSTTVASNAAVKTETTSVKKEEFASCSTPVVAKKPAKDDKFKALLEMVRAKEAAKLAKNMHRSPAVEREIAMLSRMNEMIRIIYTFFFTTKAKSLKIDVVAKKISESFSTSMQHSEVVKHLDYLVDLKLSNTDAQSLWLKKIEANHCVYLQMGSAVNLVHLAKQIDQRVKTLKS